MKRAFLVLLLFAFVAKLSAGTQLIPVMSGQIGDRLYRTTLELRSNATDQCTFEIQPLNGRKFEAVQQLEPTHPVVLRDFGGEFRVSSATRVTCAGDVEILSRIQESTDGGATYSRGVFFSAPAREPLVAGESAVVPVQGALTIAEVSGRAVHVKMSCYAARLNGVSEREYDLGPREQHIIQFTEDVGPVEATISVSGEGNVLLSTQLVALQQAAALAAIRNVVAAPFKAAPFQDPDTGLVYMRDRWYDPRTGTFLTPDPQGYGDSANLYAYCGGDPVNCSDPTGNAASVSRSGTIIGIRPDGSRYTITRAEGMQDPKRVLSILESDADLGFGDQEEIMTQAGLPIPFSSACAPGESCISSKTRNRRAFTHRPRNGKWVEAAFVATTGLPPQTREQEIMSGVVDIASAASVTSASVRARARGGAGRGAEPVFETRTGVQVGVNSFMTAAYGAPAPPVPQPGVSPFDQYKQGLAMDMGKPVVRDPALARIIDDLYRQDAALWSGSTADAVRYERLNGKPVAGRWHTQKAEEGANRLLLWMAHNPEISSDRAAAEAVYRDLRQALAIPNAVKNHQ